MSKTTSTPLYLGEELRTRAEEAARAAGMSLSGWVREAIVERLKRQERIADGLAAMREWDAEDGPVPADMRATTRRELEDLGVLPVRRSA